MPSRIRAIMPASKTCPGLNRKQIPPLPERGSAGQNSSMQTRGHSADAVGTPKASFIPAQGKRPGFIALKAVSGAEGTTHLPSASRATASNR
jgi:hypothetical protein